MLAGVRRIQQLRVPGQRPYLQLAVGHPDIGQLAEPVDVDQGFRLGQAQLHHGDEAVPAGQDPRFGAIPGEQGQGMRNAGRLLVLDLRRNLHAALPTTGRSYLARVMSV